MHPEVRPIVESASVETALELARAAAAKASPLWNDAGWLTVAAAANSAAITDPTWLALCIFAHEQRSADVAVIDALAKRARFITEAGPAPQDPFRDPAVFFEGVRRYVGNDSAPAAVQAFQAAMDVVFTAERESPEWSAARLQFMRGRRLRDLGGMLRCVAEAGVPIPDDLAPWLAWATLQELDGKVVA
jgi:hypothetical protein